MRHQHGHFRRRAIRRSVRSRTLAMRIPVISKLDADGTTRSVEHDPHAGGAVEQAFQMKADQLVAAA